MAADRVVLLDSAGAEGVGAPRTQGDEPRHPLAGLRGLGQNPETHVLAVRGSDLDGPCTLIRPLLFGAQTEDNLEVRVLGMSVGPESDTITGDGLAHAKTPKKANHSRSEM